MSENGNDSRIVDPRTLLAAWRAFAPGATPRPAELERIRVVVAAVLRAEADAGRLVSDGGTN